MKIVIEGGGGDLSTHTHEREREKKRIYFNIFKKKRLFAKRNKH